MALLDEHEVGMGEEAKSRNRGRLEQGQSTSSASVSASFPLMERPSVRATLKSPKLAHLVTRPPQPLTQGLDRKIDSPLSAVGGKEEEGKEEGKEDKDKVSTPLHHQPLPHSLTPTPPSNPTPSPTHQPIQAPSEEALSGGWKAPKQDMVSGYGNRMMQGSRDSGSVWMDSDVRRLLQEAMADVSPSSPDDGGRVEKTPPSLQPHHHPQQATDLPLPTSHAPFTTSQSQSLTPIQRPLVHGEEEEYEGEEKVEDEGEGEDGCERRRE